MQNLKNITQTKVKLNYTLKNNGIQIQFIMRKNKYNDLTYTLNINKKTHFLLYCKRLYRGSLRNIWIYRE